MASDNIIIGKITGETQRPLLAIRRWQLAQGELYSPDFSNWDSYWPVGAKAANCLFCNRGEISLRQMISNVRRPQSERMMETIVQAQERRWFSNKRRKIKIQINSQHDQTLPASPMDDKCTCGLHAYRFDNKDIWVYRAPVHNFASNSIYGRRPEMAMEVLGVVKCWGKTILHEKGLRSQYAQPVALFTPDRGPYATLTIADEEFELAARKHSLELLSYKMLKKPHKLKKALKPYGEMLI